MLERLKDLEQQYVFLRWVTGNDYGKIEYVGDDNMLELSFYHWNIDFKVCFMWQRYR